MENSENNMNLPTQSLDLNENIQYSSTIDHSKNETMQTQLAQEMDLETNELFSDTFKLCGFLANKTIAVSTSVLESFQEFAKELPKLQSNLSFLENNRESDNLIHMNDQDAQSELLTVNQKLNILEEQLKDIKKTFLDLLDLKNGLRERYNIPDDKRNNKLLKFSVPDESIGNSTNDLFLLKTGEPTKEPAANQAVAPKLLAKLPKEVEESGVDKPELLRLAALYELIETEADYLNDLNTMLTFHKVQLQECGLFKEHEINIFFSNTLELKEVNQAMYNKFMARKAANVFIEDIGDIIAECAASLDIYSTYASNYPNAQKLVNSYKNQPGTRDIFEALMNAPEGRGLSFESFLIKPVQRICKYPLLIRELQRHNEKAGKTSDLNNLELAAEKIGHVVMTVNEATRQAEEIVRIANIQNTIQSESPLNLDDKKLLKDGIMFRYFNGKPKERYIVLYTDLILICTKLEIRGPPRYELEAGFGLAELNMKLGDGRETVKSMKAASIFQLININTNSEIIYLSGTTDEQTMKWVEIFGAAFGNITEEHRSAVRSIKAQESQKSLRGSQRLSTAPEGIMSLGRSTLGRGKTTKSGLSSIALRKATSSKLKMDMSINIDDMEPPEATIKSVLFRKTLSATGHSYYYSPQTKETIWTLPDVLTVADINASTQPKILNEPEVEAAEEHEFEEEEGVSLKTVEGFSNWRMVCREGERPYYFHIGTEETSWEVPTRN